MSGQTSYNITSADAVFMLTVGVLYPTPQQLQSFEADKAWETEDIEPAETRMGVDGAFAAGWVPVPIEQRIYLLPGSPSARIFDVWYNSENVSRTKYFATCTITLTSNGQKYVGQNGVLRRYKPMPDGEKVLSGRQFTIEWGSFTSAVL